MQKTKNRKRFNKLADANKQLRAQNHAMRQELDAAHNHLRALQRWALQTKGLLEALRQVSSDVDDDIWFPDFLGDNRDEIAAWGDGVALDLKNISRKVVDVCNTVLLPFDEMADMAATETEEE